MTNPSADQLRELLVEVSAEHLDGDLISSGVARIEDGKITLRYPYPGQSVGERAVAAIKKRLDEAGVDAAVTIETVIAPRLCQGGVERLDGVKNLIAVASAKGGVGKSTVAINLALALQAEGASTGVLDADIHGPSIAAALGESEKPLLDEQDRLVPLELAGLQVMSMGYLVDQEQPMVWRGPMLIKALRQFLRDTAWSGLDFLIVDLPPGTGDVQLSLAQHAPIAGAIVVSTPQELALADAVRGVGMFAKVSVPVLGCVANMTHFVCPDCGAKHAVFGGGEVADFARERELELLAELPLDPSVSSSAAPVMIREPDSEASQAFRELAVRVGMELLKRPEDRGAKLPQIQPS